MHLLSAFFSKRYLFLEMEVYLHLLSAIFSNRGLFLEKKVSILSLEKFSFFT